MKKSTSTIDTQSVRERMTDKALEAVIARNRLERPVLTSETMAAVEQLDTIGGDDTLPDVVSFEVTTAIGVFAGIKPAGIVAPGALEYAGVNSQQFTNVIDAMGLHAVPAMRPGGDQLLMISRHRELAEELDAIWVDSCFGRETDERLQRKMGALLGYPATSTEYFITRLRTHEATGEWLEHANQPEMTAYTQFIFSPEHYETELAAYSTPLEEAVKIIAPQTYVRNMESAKEDGNLQKKKRMAHLVGRLRRRQVDSEGW